LNIRGGGRRKPARAVGMKKKREPQKATNTPRSEATGASKKGDGKRCPGARKSEAATQ